MLLEQPDAVKSLNEADIHDDDNHNVETVANEGDDDFDEFDSEEVPAP